jgi:Ca2+-binding RTX toxin-like protein
MTLWLGGLMGHAQLFDGYTEGAFLQSDLAAATRIVQSSTRQEIGWGAGYHLILTGFGFTFNGPTATRLASGTVTGLDLLGPYGHIVITGASADGAVLGLAYLTGEPTLSASTLGAGDDLIEVMGTTAPATDTDFTANGWGGADTMLGGGSRSSLFGGDGNDTIQARAGDGNYLRGDAGADLVTGAQGFDDINGNAGNDSLSGGLGGDWVVGGRDNDLQYGDAGADIVWGNLGDDTLDGGDGFDQVRGGQGDDVVGGGAGDDFVSGDRGDDTVIGGTGADIFHGSQDAGLDRVLDFRISEGDRVMLDPGTTYTLLQVGADTVLNMGGGNQMILVGVTMSALPAGSIFLG